MKNELEGMRSPEVNDWLSQSQVETIDGDFFSKFGKLQRDGSVENEYDYI